MLCPEIFQNKDHYHHRHHHYYYFTVNIILFHKNKYICCSCIFLTRTSGLLNKPPPLPMSEFVRISETPLPTSPLVDLEAVAVHIMNCTFENIPLNSPRLPYHFLKGAGLLLPGKPLRDKKQEIRISSCLHDNSINLLVFFSNRIKGLKEPNTPLLYFSWLLRHNHNTSVL